MRLLTLQAGRPQQHEDGFRTGYGKARVEGPVRIFTDHLDGDWQADRRYHGGPDMAVLAYAASHYARWREELDWPSLPHGGFGENCTVEGATEGDTCIGDVWRLGSATLQIASPRKPCRTISRYWRKPELLRLVEETGRIGWYLRVLEEGVVEEGQGIELLERPHPEWTVARAMHIARQRKHDPEPALLLGAVAALSDRWKAFLRDEAKV